jgi:drug/metabolite transporter (DMT)-like permease
MTKEREGELFTVTLSVLESLFPILSIITISLVGALHTYAFSLFIALLFFLVLMWKKNLFVELKNKRAYKDLLLTSFFITLLFVLIFLGLRYTTAGNMSVIIFLQLLFSYLYFNIFGREKMDRLHTLGALIMGIGALIILFPDDMQLNKGDLLIFIAAAVAPIANYYSKLARKHCASETILGFRTLIALPVIALLAFMFEPTFSQSDLYAALPYLLVIGFIIFGVSKVLWMEALHRISITKMSAIVALVPVMTLFFAWLFLDELPQNRQILGILPVLFGGYLLTKPLKVKEAKHK